MSAKNVFFGGDDAHSGASEAGLLLFRVFLGLSLALGHGWGKMPVSADAVFVKKIGNSLSFLPEPVVWGWIAATIELVGGVLLAIGLLTRPAACFIVVMMAFAAFGIHWGDGYAVMELALLYLFGALPFLFGGAGKVSVDALIRK